MCGLPAIHHTKPIDPVTENEQFTIYWDLQVLNRGTIKHSQPDMILFDHVRKKIFIIEIAIAWFERLELSYLYKKEKYGTNSNITGEEEMQLPYAPGNSLRAEMETLHSGYSAKVIPIIIGCTGEVQRSVYDGLREIGLTHAVTLKTIEGMQLAAGIGTSIIIRAHMSMNNN